MRPVFLPEGSLLHTPENLANCATVEGLLKAMNSRTVLEGVAVSCNPEHDLSVRLGPFTGIIPREEVALGIKEGNTREIAILSRVGKPVSALVTEIRFDDEGLPSPILSRCQAQALALGQMLALLSPGDIIPATVSHLESFGAFVDVGCGVPSMIGIENISVSRLTHAKERFKIGQSILAVVTGLDKEKGRILLSHKELLGTWKENAVLFSPGMTVPGIIRSVKDYGLFVELTPNLSGLADPREDYSQGERVSAYIKSVSPSQMKIKLLLIDHLPPEREPAEFRYFIRHGPLISWRYAPEGARKQRAQRNFL